MGDSNDTLIEAIGHYQRSLDKGCRNKDNVKILYSIEKLYKLPIKVRHLEDTGIGRTVNGLRKLGGDVGEAAKSLVAKWKEMVCGNDKEASQNNVDREERNRQRDRTSSESGIETSADENSASEGDSSASEHSSAKEESSSDEETDREEERRRNNDNKNKHKEESDQEKAHHSKKDRELEHKKDKERREESSSKSRKNRDDSSEDEDRRNKYKREGHGSKSRHSDAEENHKHSKDKKNRESSSHSDKKNKHKRESKSQDSESEDESKSRQSSSKEKRDKSKSRRERHDSSEEESRKKPKVEDRKSKSSERDSQKSKSKRERRDSTDDEEPRKRQKLEKKDREDSRSKKEAALSSDQEEYSEKTKKEKKEHESKSRDDSSSRHKQKSSEKDSRKHGSEETKKDKHSSDKEKHKSAKKDKERSDDSRNKQKSSSDKSSSSGNKHEKSDKNKEKEKQKSKDSAKVKTKSAKVPSEKINAIVNGIDSESGASFAEALGMLGMYEPAASTKSPLKKKSTSENQPKPSASTSTSFPSKDRPERYEKHSKIDAAVPKLLRDVNLEPLDINISTLLPSITPNYRPLGLPVESQQRKIISDDEALSRVIGQKNQRTKVYSGNKVAWQKVPTLFEICTRILQDNIDALEYTGGVPYLILKPILEKANPDQLFTLEHHNPYLIEDSDELWLLHCQKEFRNKKREEMESWREMYMRCLDEREAKLKALTANIKQTQEKSTPVRTTKMAFMDNMVKPPRNIARKQAKNGTAFDVKRPMQTPASRLSQLATAGEAGKIAVPNPGSRAVDRGGGSSSSSHLKPKKAPLMAKTLSLIKNSMKNHFGRR